MGLVWLMFRATRLLPYPSTMSTGRYLLDSPTIEHETWNQSWVNVFPLNQHWFAVAGTPPTTSHYLCCTLPHNGGSAFSTNPIYFHFVLPRACSVIYQDSFAWRIFTHPLQQIPLHHDTLTIKHPSFAVSNYYTADWQLRSFDLINVG